MQRRPSSSLHAYPLHTAHHSTQAAESPNNLPIIPALQGDGSILLPFVSCHLAMLIMQKPPLSLHSVGIHTAVHFQADNYPQLLHKRRTRILSIYDVADRLLVCADNGLVLNTGFFFPFLFIYPLLVVTERPV